MKNLGFIAIFLIFSCILAFSQTTVDGPQAERIGVDSAQQNLQEIAVDKFEDAGFWEVAMPIDSGIITYRRLAGGPADKNPIEEEEELGIQQPDQFVIGVKAQFFRRGDAAFTVKPVRPIPIPGITKTISIWVVGRNTKHRLVLNIQDHFGNKARLNMGTLNFSGWKELTVAVPPSITQRDYHYINKMGLKVTGFTIETDMMETYGSYYIYFDGLRAVTDLFGEGEDGRDEDDMTDTW